MSKVEMSLQEYDQLKDQLNLYEEIVYAIAKPCISGWQKDWYEEDKNNKAEVISNLRLSDDAKSFLESLISIHSKEYIRENNLEGNFDLNIQIILGKVSHINSESEE
jgi:hypothetical protein